MKRGSLYDFANQVTVWAIRLGIPRPPYTRKNGMIVETVGRRSGRRRRVPVAYLEEKGKFIVVVENGAHSQWVQNALAQEGRLRVFLRGQWRSARLQVLDTDPELHLLRMDRLHASLLRQHSTSLGLVALELE